MVDPHETVTRGAGSSAVEVGESAPAKCRGAMGMPPSRAPIQAPALTVLTAEPGLSLAAKGLAAFVLSRPRRPITFVELFRSTSDPMPMISGAVRELVKAGMVETVRPTKRGDRSTGGIQLRQPS
jgi:hypothetical protein